ncbi:hypothetical protein ACFZAM_00950 [Streptomyces sp. NPDC008079]|uniref:SCO2400 family protein n=1 Tax=Streptomyces sp. NPDC008079 TaxID=3364806 RepID=UPI0036E931E5
MDYCYTCRRSVNGALVCPGCGAYAPETDAAPVSYADPASYPAPVSYADPAPYEPAAYIPEPSVFPAAPVASASADEERTASVVGPSSLVPRLQGGRAARRRQLERWKKNRRRAGVATAVALFGGGVTVASMQNHGSGRGTTASSSYDTVTPVTLRTDNAQATDPTSGPHAAAPATQRHTRTPALPTAQATHPAATNAGTAPLPATSPATGPAPSASTAPSTPPSTGTQAVNTGTGTAADTPADPGTTTTAPPATTPADPASPSTSPTTPPAHQGLCILILCLP